MIQIHNQIEKLFFNFFDSEFEMSLIKKILFYYNNNFYDVVYIDKKIEIIKNIDLVKNESKKFDLVIIKLNETDIFENIKKILSKNCNDLILIYYNKKYEFQLNFKEIQININIWHQLNAKLKKIFGDKTKFHLIKISDNPRMDPSLFIQNICNDNSDIYHLKTYKKNYFQQFFKKLTTEIKSNFENKTHLSFLRFGDGDFYFLRNIYHGSNSIGARSLTKKLNTDDISFYRKSFWQIKNICIERTHDSNTRLYFELLFSYFDKSKFLRVIFKIIKLLHLNNFMQKLFIFFLSSRKINKLINSNLIHKFLFLLLKKRSKILKRYDLIDNIKNDTFYPFETIYALVSTRWIFTEFKKDIALVGNIEKINLIKKLTKNKFYREYLGIEKFSDYICIPQKGAANDLKVANDIKKQIEKSKAKIFLLGIGSIKIPLLSMLRDNNKIFIDVGCGIDALAGLVSHDRPYFSRWTNYQFKDVPIDKIDVMDQNNPNRFSKKYKMITII